MNLAYPSVLYVWSGQDPTISDAADFVAVVDFSEKSPTYGKILKTVPLVSDASISLGQSKNEPHHSSISLDGKYYITGGLLSFLEKQKEVFIWRVSTNVKDGPEFVRAIDVPAACPDEFLPIGGSKFLLSMMCNDSAVSPGTINLIDAETGSGTTYVKDATTLSAFNPHGFSRLTDGSIFTADYIDPSTLAGTDPSKIQFRNTVRHFSVDGNLLRSFQFEFPTKSDATSGVGQGVGLMDVRVIPKDPLNRAYSCGTNTNLLYLLGPDMNEPLAVFDISQVNNHIKRLSAGLVWISPDGKRMIMTFQMRFVILFNIEQPEYPFILQTFDFCTDSILDTQPISDPSTNEITTFRQFCVQNSNMTGSHAIIRPDGEKRFVVVNYFLKFGLAQFAGTRTIHAFQLNHDITKFTYDTRFNPNSQGDLTFYSRRSYPHHVQYIKTSDI